MAIPQEFVFVDLEEDASIEGVEALSANDLVLQNHQDRTFDPSLWYENFKIPWEKMPRTLIHILDQGRRPSEEDMKVMLKIICEEIRKFDLNPNMQILNVIAHKAFEMFPESLCDDPAVPLSDYECQILQIQLKNKLMDYFNVKVQLIDIQNRIDLSFYKLCQCTDQLNQNDMPKLYSSDNHGKNCDLNSVNKNKLRRSLQFKKKGSGSRPKTNREKSTKAYRHLNKKENIKPRKPKFVNHHCCNNWRPRKLPKKETKRTQFQKKEQLKIIAASNPNTLNDQTIQLLEETFYSQRKDIIKSENIMTIMKEWPLLFTKDGLLNHFKLLTGVDSLKKLNDSFLTKANTIFYYFLTLSKNGYKALNKFFEVLDKSENLDRMECAAIIIFLIMVYFKEAHENLFLTTKVLKAENSTGNFQVLPKTPCILICGDSLLFASNYMLCINGKIVNREITDFTTGFAMLFTSYHVFNICYPVEVKATLEFVEKYLFDVQSRPNISDIRVFSLVKILECYQREKVQ